MKYNIIDTASAVSAFFSNFLLTIKSQNDMIS